MSKIKQVNELLENIVTTRENLVGAILYDNQLSVITSCFSKDLKDKEEKIIESLQPKMDAILKEFESSKSSQFGSLTTDFEDYHIISCEAGDDKILCVLTAKESAVDVLFPYVFLLTEKIIRIYLGRNVSTLIPNFDENQGENKIASSAELVKIGIQEGRFRMKVVLGGDSGVGKTTLVSKFVDENLNDDFKSTIGVNIMKKSVNYPKWNVQVDMSIFDTAGQLVFHQVRKTYLKEASAGFIVFDVTRPETFKSVDGWYREMRSASPDVMLILVGNKIDLPRRISTDVARQLARKYRMGYIETSALDKDMVDEAFYTIGFSFIQRARLMRK